MTPGNYNQTREWAARWAVKNVPEYRDARPTDLAPIQAEIERRQPTGSVTWIAVTLLGLFALAGTLFLLDAEAPSNRTGSSAPLATTGPSRD